MCARRSGLTGRWWRCTNAAAWSASWWPTRCSCPPRWTPAPLTSPSRCCIAVPVSAADLSSVSIKGEKQLGVDAAGVAKQILPTALCRLFQFTYGCSSSACAAAMSTEMDPPHCRAGRRQFHVFCRRCLIQTCWREPALRMSPGIPLAKGPSLIQGITSPLVGPVPARAAQGLLLAPGR